MEENGNSNSFDELKEMSVQSGNEIFSPDQMISCPKCERKNPPTRLKCLYCTADLPATEFSADQQLSRKLESWEKGFNLIFLPNQKNIESEKIPGIAKILRLEPENCERILRAEKILPLARAESANEAEILAANLREKSLETAIVGDEKLAVETSQQRLRGLEFFEDKIALKLFNADKTVEILREDLSLIVTGALFERRIESTQKHQRKKENKLLETTEIGSDETLLDIYDKQNAVGYRIESNGFDFSCLGSEKELLAMRNIKKLVEKLRVFAPDANFDESYNRFRAEIGCVWEVEERKDSKGMQKKGFGKINFEIVTIINNLKQFTRYSRMLRNLL